MSIFIKLFYSIISIVWCFLQISFFTICNTSVWRWPNAVVTGAFIVSIFAPLQYRLRVPTQYRLRVPTNSYPVMCYISGFLYSYTSLQTSVTCTMCLSLTRKQINEQMLSDVASMLGDKQMLLSDLEITLLWLVKYALESRVCMKETAAELQREIFP